MTATGKLERIWIKRFNGGPMDRVQFAELHAGRGLANNANQGGKRQVTLIALERWRQVMQQLGADIDPSARRANLLLSGIELENSRHRLLQIGTCRIRIWGETRPCDMLDNVHRGLKEALKVNWGGGAFGEVLFGGRIREGDAVHWVEGE